MPCWRSHCFELTGVNGSVWTRQLLLPPFAEELSIKSGFEGWRERSGSRRSEIGAHDPDQLPLPGRACDRLGELHAAQPVQPVGQWLSPLDHRVTEVSDAATVGIPGGLGRCALNPTAHHPQLALLIVPVEP